MKKIFLTLLILQILQAQPAPIVQVFPADDSHFSGGTLWTPADQPNLGQGLDPLFQKLRYGNFNFTISLPPGMYAVTVTTLEPTQSAARLRIFSILANGQQSAPIDLYSILGNTNTTPYEIPFFVNVESTLTISFQASVRSAVCSFITIRTWMPGAQPVASIN